MTIVQLVAPPGVTGSFADSGGHVAVIDATGRVQVDPTVAVLADFYRVGFMPDAYVASAVRPSETYPGQPCFDTTLNGGTGRPIWRSADNTRWVDSTGTTV